MAITSLAPSITYSTQSTNGIAAAGQMIVASNIAVGTPAAGTGVTWVAAQTSFSDTQPNFYIQNLDPVKSLHLICLKMVANAVGTAAVSWQYAGVLDPTARSITTNHVSLAATFVPNTNATTGTGYTLPSVQYQSSATASAFSASSGKAAMVSRGSLGALNVIGDEFIIKFGTFDASGTTALTAAESGGVGSRASCDGPVIIAPNSVYTLTIWGPSSSAAFAPDFSFFMAAL